MRRMKKTKPKLRIWYVECGVVVDMVFCVFSFLLFAFFDIFFVIFVVVVFVDFFFVVCFFIIIDPTFAFKVICVVAFVEVRSSSRQKQQ